MTLNELLSEDSQDTKYRFLVLDDHKNIIASVSHTYMLKESISNYEVISVHPIYEKKSDTNALYKQVTIRGV